jgi:hypothetical protein
VLRVVGAFMGVCLLSWCRWTEFAVPRWVMGRNLPLTNQSVG